MSSPYLRFLMKKDRETAAKERQELGDFRRVGEVPPDPPAVKAATAAELTRWHEQRAAIERAMGRNQLEAGNAAGQWRVDRAEMHHQTADMLRSRQ